MVVSELGSPNSECECLSFSHTSSNGEQCYDRFMDCKK